MRLGNPSAWWNANLSIEFLRFHFGSRANMEEKILLLWDDCSAHWTAEVRQCASDINVILLKVPASYTWICQPADLSWNKPLKDTLRTTWVYFLREQFSLYQDNVNFKMLVPKRNQVVEWVSKAWDCISSQTIISGFIRAKLLLDDYEGELEEEVPETLSGNAVDVVERMERLGLLDRMSSQIVDENDICERADEEDANSNHGDEDESE